MHDGVFVHHDACPCACDTGRDRGDVHIGTLLRIMPSDDCEGGSLVIEGRRITPSRNEDCLVFIPFGVPHLVTPVTAGVRWAAKASVHVPTADSIVADPPAGSARGRTVVENPSLRRRSTDSDEWEHRRHLDLDVED